MADKLKKIAIYGAGGFGLEVAMLIRQINEVAPQWEIIGFFDDGVAENEIRNGLPVLGGINRLNQWDAELFLVLALGMPDTKKAVFMEIHNRKVRFPVLIHPNVVIGEKKYVTIGEGSILCAGVIVTTNISIGRHVILNLACTIGHESKIGDFSSLMPTCNISGEVAIGQASYWGTGAKVINRKHVGANTIVGAGAVVIDDIPSNVVAVGAPARVIKKNR